MDDRPVGVFELVVKGECPALALHLDPLLVMDGGTASETASSERPAIMRVVDDQGLEVGPGGHLYLGDRRGRFEVSVSMPADCAVTVTARLSSEDAG